ncbi:MAG: hypothetical protein V4481_05240 [Patescibacteria group bacterium]
MKRYLIDGMEIYTYKPKKKIRWLETLTAGIAIGLATAMAIISVYYSQAYNFYQN